MRGAIDARLHPQVPGPSRTDVEQRALTATGGSSPSIRFDVARTPQEVYEFLADAANWARMDRALVSLTLDGPVVVGSSGTATHRRAGGVRTTTSLQVTALVPGVHLAMRIVGRGYAATETIDLAATTRGTAVQIADRFAGTALLGRLMVRLSGGMVDVQLQERSTRLRSLVEVGVAGHPGGREAC